MGMTGALELRLALAVLVAMRAASSGRVVSAAIRRAPGGRMIGAALLA
ncbi:hypothetical protein [Catenulispora rubra]|nr:hypothetical protein [Catenulispora rubra]